MRDERVVYGAVCTWWGGIADVGLVPFEGEAVRGNLPACPHCHGPLFEMDNLAVWEAAVQRCAAETGDARYPTFVAWLKGRPCIPLHLNGYAKMRQQYEEDA